jgi:alkanesulfonate monooxygenase SsuD/methylene tetrahydromethanopterin reductase-like flavin-dependent oxidoreductase (luciferase family)
VRSHGRRSGAITGELDLTRTVRTGIYTDLRNPPQWRQPWQRHYDRVLETIADAEAWGVDSVWLSEHHGFEDGYLPQPLTFAAAIAARTSRVRIGTAILLAGLRPALDIAEQVAIVDILSGGRMELGVGAGYRAAEYEAFGSDITRRYELLEERVTGIRALWESGGCTPPPVQERVPIWLGGMGPRIARMAGRLGEGLLWLDRALLEPYAEGLERGGHVLSSARVGGVVNLILADDPEAAWARIRPHFRYQRESYGRYAAGGVKPGMANPPTLSLGPGHDPADLRGPADQPIPPRFDVVTVGDAIDRLRPWLASMPVTDVFLWESIAGMPEDLVSRHVELVARELRPALAGATSA